MPDPDPAAAPDPDQPDPDPPVEGDPPAETGDDPADVKKLKAALSAERRSRVVAERAAAKLRDEHATDAEKAIDAARAEGRREALGQVAAQMVDAEVRASAAGRLADPADATRLLEVGAFVDGETGEIDRAGIAAAIDDLIENKPYLRAAPAGNGSTPVPPAPQGTRPGPAVESDGDAFLRRVVRGT
jgi:hypothetical protein